jgi:hypothetical protein
MREPRKKSEIETVIVEVRGQLLDRLSFPTRDQADSYKRAVRRWAREKGILIGIWSRRNHQIWAAAF